VDVNDSDDLDGGDESADDPSALVKKLRGELKARDKELAEAKTARRELAFVKAGIDTSTKLGQLFVKSYDGDIADVEAIKAEAVDLGILQVPSTTGDNAADSDEPGDTSAQERSSLASGATGDDGSGVDPRQTAISRAQEAMKQGATFEHAAGGFVAELAKAAMSGDQRVVIKGTKY
jgi:hypothetical protein